jgi:TorA maturation chaperone TorD
VKTAEPAARDPDRQRLADVYVLLSRCFQHPDDALVAAVASGRVEATLRDRLDSFGVDIDSRPTEVPAEFPAAYMRTFEAFQGPYAPPVESVYETWWDGTDRELLSGPPARDMDARYEAQDMDVPAGYPPDHLSLLLEYGSVLLEAGATEAYLAFHDAHFDWIPAFRDRVSATCTVPFYRWVVDVLERVLDLARHECQPDG